MRSLLTVSAVRNSGATTRVDTKFHGHRHIREPGPNAFRTGTRSCFSMFYDQSTGNGISAKDKHMLKCSVAIAALLISAPVAFAQGAGDARHGSDGMTRSGPGMSQSDAGGARLKSGSGSQENSGSSSGASSGSSGAESSASDYAPGERKGSGSAKEYAPGQTKTQGSASENAPGHLKDQPDNMGKRSEGKANARDNDRSADRGEKKTEHNAKNDSDRGRNGASTGASEGTEGRASGGRGSVASVTTEQKTQIKSVFTHHHVEPARNINVSVNVGVRIPHSVKLYPVPEDVIAIVPVYRDYMYVMLDDDRVAIIDPDSYEVVDIIVLA